MAKQSISKKVSAKLSPKAVAKSGAGAKARQAPLIKQPPVGSVVPKLDVRNLRQGLGLTRQVFSRLSHSSERAIANWEAGEALGAQSQQRMIELQRLQVALAKVVEPTYVGEWLQAPNDAFAGLKPLEVIERGETDRIWRMIYLLESGTPS